MGKTIVNYNRPIIVGFVVLELSKYLMYDFHYNTMVKKYKDKITLILTDTDSLIYHIKTDDLYDDFNKMKEKFDFSDYPKDHKNFSEENKKLIGKFKDEANGKQIIEVVALRAKMYAFSTEEKCLGKNKDFKAVAKGIKRNQIENMTMEKYKRCLFGDSKEDIQQNVSFNLIRSKNHQINSIRVNKIGLCSLDNKKYVMNNNINTLALGHKDIKNII
jgi:hypothetical protein